MDLTAVPGLPETALSDEAVARLPGSAPPAPWALDLRAVLWLGGTALGRGGAAALGEGGAAALRATSPGSARVLLSGGGLIRYLDTPVGLYSEVLAATVVLDGRRLAVHVPFMAVDSTASLVGGRANWALPKTLARFDGEPRAGERMVAEGERWSLTATARAGGPSLPFRARFAVMQRWPDGTVRRAPGRMSGRARLARVSVDASGGPRLRTLLPSGRRLGVLVESARGTLAPSARVG